jgi:ribosome-binding protein aMBF1 (putative translation factor)
MKNPPNTRRRSDGLRILERVTGRDAQLRKDIAEANVNFRMAQLIYDARTAAGLTQQQLADLIGTRQSVIARLEDAEYRGHSLTMLARIADALHRQLEVAFVPPGQRAKRLRRKAERRRESPLRPVRRQA